MYFKSRAEAGQQLAKELIRKYRGTPCAVVCLTDGGVVVGAQIAMELHCVMMMLLTDSIDLPREPIPLAGLSQDGSLTYNDYYSQGEIDEMLSEYHGVVEEERMQKLHNLHSLVGRGGLIRKDLVRDHTVIVVSDGMNGGFSLDIAAAFLKTIQIKRLVVAVPFANVPAVDRMHILADEIYCLNVVEDYISTDHYYDDNSVPSHEAVLKTIQEIVANWR
ncbi:MAG TPA: hypothetical protein VIM53_04010 [Candidatus Saccharimonadales bacterium]